jgi:hypothetical protein
VVEVEDLIVEEGEDGWQWVFGLLHDRSI